MISFLINYIKGFVVFSAEGADIESFLTYCIQNGIEIFNPLKKDFIFYGKIYLKDYKKIRNPAKKFGIRIKICRKHGLYFFSKKHHMKIGFLTGIICVVAFCLFMNLFVWEINVKGNSETSEEKILKSAKEMGLVRGTFAKSHFVQDIEWYILKENENLASVEINIQGSIANISINEREKEEPMVSDDDIPTNLIASKYGVIRKIEVFDGQSVVKSGDAVMKGDLLVSAVFEDRHKKLTLKHARANIIAETDYNIKVEFPLEQIQKMKAEKKRNIFEFNIMGLDIKIGNDKNCNNLPFEKTEKQLDFLGIKLPIKLIITRYFNVKENNITYTFAEAKENAFLLLEKKEEFELKNCEIISRRTEEKVKNGNYTVNANYIVLMNICEEQPIESDIPWENTDDIS